MKLYKMNYWKRKIKRMLNEEWNCLWKRQIMLRKKKCSWRKENIRRDKKTSEKDDYNVNKNYK